MASPFQTLSKVVAQNFRGKLYAKGQLFREVTDSLDDFGDPQPSDTVIYPCQGIRDNFDAYYAAQAGIPLTDVSILLINGLTSAPLPILQTDKVLMAPLDNSIPAQWHQIRKILEVDPAGATTKLQAYVCDDPTVS